MLRESKEMVTFTFTGMDKEMGVGEISYSIFSGIWGTSCRSDWRMCIWDWHEYHLLTNTIFIPTHPLPCGEQSNRLAN